MLQVSLITQYIVEQIPALNMPDVCTNAPVHGKAFCKHHCEVLERRTPPIPTGLREFLEHCHTTGGLYNSNQEFCNENHLRCV